MDKSILYVDDDVGLIREVKEFFNRRNYHIKTVSDGKEAFEQIQKNCSYDVIILDLKMPVMNGEEFLELIEENNIKIPPIIILSGYLDEYTKEKCIYLGATQVFQKPLAPEDLLNIIDLVSKGTPLTNTQPRFHSNTIDYMVKRREKALHDFFMKSERSSSNHRNLINIDEPLLVIGRRWNSWYPSVFDIPGGAYAIIGPPASGETEYSEGEMPSAVIDPGFKFLEVFRELGISLESLETCIVSHNHPDHLGGIFEFMAARHAFKKATRAFCNPSTCIMLGNCSGFNLEVKELDEKYFDLFPKYKTCKKWLRIRAKSFNTAHEEIGRENSSKGLCISVQWGNEQNSLEDSNEIIILGDTEYDQAEHRDRIIPFICRHNVKVVVLHIGCSQFKQSTSKHLYLNGLHNILNDMNIQLKVDKYKGKLLVLISEWGLEHATKEQIKAICGQTIQSFNDTSPIIETIKYLQSNNFNKVDILPADIGLEIGVESGKIYINNEAIDPDNISIEVDINGLNYKKAS